MNIAFLHPWFFLLLIPIILLGVWMAYRRRPGIKIATVIPLKKSSGRKFRLTLIESGILLTLLILTAALARPRRPEGTQVIRAQGVDIILALDMSTSMACYDRPEGMSEEKFVRAINDSEVQNRLESAKNEIRNFINARPNDRIGLIGFADLAYSFVPPTPDHRLLLERLKELSPGMLGSATGIASPIGSAASRLKNSPSPRPVIVLFTDGANTAENRLSPQEAAAAAKEFNIILHTVGIGSAQCYGVDQFGRPGRAESDLDEKLLRELADISGGRYYPAADPAALATVMDEINALEKTDHETPVIELYRELTPYFCSGAAAVLLLGLIVSAAGKIRLP